MAPPLSDALFLDHLQKSKSGGRCTVVAREPVDNNPDRMILFLKQERVENLKSKAVPK